MTQPCPKNQQPLTKPANFVPLEILFQTHPSQPPSTIQSIATPSFVIHAQQVIINNYPSANSLTSENGNTIFGTASPTPPKNRARNSEDICQVPTLPTPPATPLWDLSALRSNSHHCDQPFSSLWRCSHQRQSTSAQGLNWNTNQHPRDWSQALQALGWIPPIH